MAKGAEKKEHVVFEWPSDLYKAKVSTEMKICRWVKHLNLLLPFRWGSKLAGSWEPVEMEVEVEGTQFESWNFESLAGGVLWIAR